jgi:hypothetical protein
MSFMSTLKRVVGLILIILAAIGLFTSLIVLTQIWSLKQPLTEQAQASTALISDTLGTTGEALAVADQGLQSASNNLAAVQGTMFSVAKTITDTRPAVESTLSLMSNDVPEAILAARTAISSAQTAAQGVDDVLNAFSQVTVTIDGKRLNFRPDVPFSVALGNIGQSLDEVPGAVSQVAEDLSSMPENMTQVGEGIASMAVAMGEIQDTLSETREVMKEYDHQLAQLQGMISSLNASLPTLVNALVIAITLFIFWLDVAQLATLIIGLEWFRSRRLRQQTDLA